MDEEAIMDWVIQRMNVLQYELMVLHEISLSLKIPCICDVCRKT